MPRTSQIRYYDSRKAYYTKFRGRQHLLAAGPADGPDGPTYKAAVLRFAQIMHADEVERAEDNSLVSAIIVRYYHSIKLDGDRKNTLHKTRTMLDPAIAKFGHVKIKELKPFVVTDWLAGRSTWNSSTRYTAAGCLIRAFNWAKEQGMITKNPLAGFKKSERLVRGKDVVLPDALQGLLLRTARPAFAMFLRMLQGTGARPGEIIHADCSHYRKDIGALVFPWNPPEGEWRWKCAKTTKRDRVVYLPPELQELVEGEIAKRGGVGRIFRTTKGKVWNNNHLAQRMIWLKRGKAVQNWCQKNNFNADRIMPYSFRHGYITHMIAAGCPIKLLADWCGTSVAMIEKTYSHVHDDLAAMRRLFLQFNGRPSGQPLPSPADSTP